MRLLPFSRAKIQALSWSKIIRFLELVLGLIVGGKTCGVPLSHVSRVRVGIMFGPAVSRIFVIGLAFSTVSCATCSSPRFAAQ
jgi:hypothetical protein